MMCDAYAGCDQEYEIVLNVAEGEDSSEEESSEDESDKDDKMEDWILFSFDERKVIFIGFIEIVPVLLDF